MARTIQTVLRVNALAGAAAIVFNSGVANWQVTPVQIDDDLHVDFTEVITLGTAGVIRVWSYGDNGYEQVEAIDVTAAGGGPGTASVAGTRLIIRLTDPMVQLLDYAITIDREAINEFDGVASVDTLTFRTDVGFDPASISLDPADYDHVFIDQTFSNANGIPLDLQDLNNVLVLRCRVASLGVDNDGDLFGDTGIRLQNCTNVVIYDCDIEDVYKFGIQLSDSDDNASDQVYILSNRFNNVYSDGIQVPKDVQAGEDNTNVVIWGNRLDDVAKLDPGSGKHGIYVQGSDFIIGKNTIIDMDIDANGISVRSSGIVFDNFVRMSSLRGNNAGSALKYFSDHATGPSRTLIIADNDLDGAPLVFSGIELDRTNSNQGSIPDDQWVISRAYLLRNQIGPNVQNPVIIDDALEDLGFFSAIRYDTAPGVAA
ncbi:MAG: right-handed parallel beta-helix repeat-containing protein [Pseudomonadota bacterium]